MRACRLSLLLIVLLAAGGCMHAGAPRGPAVSRAVPPAATPADLDSYAYSRRTTPAASHAQASPQSPAQAHTQGNGFLQVLAQAYARAQAQAQAQAEAQARPQADAPARQAHAADVRALPAVSAPAAQIAVIGPPRPEPPYTLDTGDKLRIVVFGQDGLSNSYFVDASGQVTMPLIGAVTARGLTTQQLARAIAGKLRGGFIREPHVAIEVETYRPFFILGEVTQPGQYPYVPNMTVETAVAIAGGYTPRAYRWTVEIDRPAEGGALRSRASVPLPTRVRPGDTVVVKERWF
jgi:polysaccharide export outer membrane protein